MSQEFACHNCRITLQVSPRQLGRPVRCPVCGLISVFGAPPAGGAEPWQPVRPGSGEQAGSAVSRELEASPDDWSPIEPTGKTPGHQANTADVKARAEQYVATYASSPFDDAPDRAWWVGLICGLISLLGGNMVCFCCLLGPFGSTFFAIAGLVATAFSKRGPKAVNIVIGSLGLLISLFMLLLMAISKLQ